MGLKGAKNGLFLRHFFSNFSKNVLPYLQIWSDLHTFKIKEIIPIYDGLIGVNFAQIVDLAVI